MQRLQTRFVLIAAVAATVALSACKDDKASPSSSSKVLSVAEYLHDLDAAQAMVKVAQSNPAKYATDTAAVNASQAVAKAMSPSMLECWPTKPASTATTDHACLDNKGFKR